MQLHALLRSITKRTSADEVGGRPPTGVAYKRWSDDKRETERRVESDAAVDQLITSGFVLLDRLAPARFVSAALAELAALHSSTRRIGGWRSNRKLHIENMLDAGRTFEALWLAPPLIDIGRMVLGQDFRILGVRYRAPLPGFGEQTLHADDAESSTNLPRVLSVIVPLVDFTSENGATRVLPGSHAAPPVEVPEDPLVPMAGQRTIVCAAGSGFVFSGALWHSGTRNRSTTPRHAIAISYVRRNSGLLNQIYASERTLARLGARAELLQP